MDEDPETRAGTPVDIGQYKQDISCRNNQETFADNLGTPSENFGDKKYTKTSRECPDWIRLRIQSKQIFKVF